VSAAARWRNPATDLYWSFLQAIVMALLVMSIDCYYGFTAFGGGARIPDGPPGPGMMHLMQYGAVDWIRAYQLLSRSP
jgi:hypothetical protein